MRLSLPIHNRAGLALLTAMTAAAPLHAQTVRDDTPPPASVPSIGAEEPVASVAAESQPRRAAQRPRIDINPYIEVGQVLTADLSGGGDVLTYTSVAAGVEAAIASRRAQGALDLRYERRIAWDDPLVDNDTISGLARGRYDVAPGFALEAGGLASRTSIDGRGANSGFFAGDRDNSATLYSIYAGPTFGRRIGEFDVGAAYRFGWSRSEVDVSPLLPPGAARVGNFEDATNHAAMASIGQRPGASGLPVGWRLSGGWEREDAGQLDHRYEGWHGRFDLTLPVSPTVALVGGVGYEDITVSYRPPLLDADGEAVTDGIGRLVPDPSEPRRIAFDTDGLIWDAGVLWRPNRRMSLEARIGRRYDDWTYTGTWSLQASENTTYGLSVYDSLTTVGRQLSAGLAALPTDFDLVRNPIDGSFGGCAFGAGGGTCLTPAMGNLTGFAFRNRGAVLSVAHRARPWNIGVAVGYDRRNYVAQGLAEIPELDGLVDETWFAYLSASRQLSRRTSFGSALYANWFDSGLGGDAFAAGGSASLSHEFRPRLSGNAAVAVNMIDPEGFDSQTFASALLGLRYSFR